MELASHFSFSFGVLALGDVGKGAGRVVPLSALGLPCLRTSGSGHWRQSLEGSSVLRDG